LPAGLAKLIRSARSFQLDRLAKTIAIKNIARSAILKITARLDRCPAASAARRAGGSNGYRWITGPIATVLDGHKLPKVTVGTRFGGLVWEWFSEGTGSSTVVCGNHPYSVRRSPSPRWDASRQD